MPFCTSCGSAIHDGQKFCENCGAPVGISAQPNPAGQAPVPSPAIQAPVTQPPVPQPSAGSQEEVWGVSAATRKKGFLAGTERYALVMTSRRVILVLVTQEMIDSAVQAAHAAAPAGAGGLMARAKQFVEDKVTEMKFYERYLTMPPGQALAENPANRSLDAGNVTSIKVSVLKKASDEHHHHERYTGFGLDFQTAEGEYVFTIEYREGIVKYLQDMFGEKVHLPLGYASGWR